MWGRWPDKFHRHLSNSLPPCLPPNYRTIACNTSLHRSRFTNEDDSLLHNPIPQVLSGYHGDLMKGTVIFIPSYLDFVRVRNLLKKEEVSFASISE